MDAIFLLVFIFAVAGFLGFELITKVPATLHTPLMSGSNAISGVTIVGALASTQFDQPILATILAFFAIVFATVNVVGGFVVTDRMLASFGTKKKKKKES